MSLPHELHCYQNKHAVRSRMQIQILIIYVYVHIQHLWQANSCYTSNNGYRIVLRTVVLHNNNTNWCAVYRCIYTLLITSDASSCDIPLLTNIVTCDSVCHNVVNKHKNADSNVHIWAHCSHMYTSTALLLIIVMLVLHCSSNNCCSHEMLASTKHQWQHLQLLCWVNALFTCAACKVTTHHMYTWLT